MVTRPSQLPAETVTVTATETVLDKKMFIHRLQVGDCFSNQEWVDGDGMVTRLSCQDEHDAEVVFAGPVTYEADPPYPSDEQWKSYYHQYCEPMFKQYVGVPRSESQMEALWITTAESDWEKGRHNVLCYAKADTPWKGSAKGSNR